MNKLILKLAASLPVGDETRRALIKMAEAPKGKLKEFLDEVGDQKVTNPVTKNKVKVKTLSTYPKDSPAYRLFWDEYQRWLKEQEEKPSWQVSRIKKGPYKGMFENTYDIRDWAEKTQNTQREQWTPEQKYALLSYTGNGHEKINRTLRFADMRDLDPEDPLDNKFRKLREEDLKGIAQLKDVPADSEDFNTKNLSPTATNVVHLDKLFASPEGKMNTEVVVKRGVGDKHPLYKMLEEGTLKEGYVFEDPAYQSTTLDHKMTKFSHPENKVGFAMVIRIPKGTPAVYVGSPPHEYSDFPHEYEVLLNRGAKLKITATKTQKGQHIVYADVLPE